MNSYNLKRGVLYVLSSTGAVVFFLTIFIMFSENKTINANTIWEIIGSNIVITVGLFLTNKIELRYAIFEFLLDIGFMTAVIIAAGLLFKWYNIIPVWVSLIIVLMIYVLFYLLDVVRVGKDIKEINKMLQELKDKEINAADRAENK